MNFLLKILNICKVLYKLQINHIKYINRKIKLFWFFDWKIEKSYNFTLPFDSTRVIN